VTTSKKAKKAGNRKRPGKTTRNPQESAAQAWLFSELADSAVNFVVRPWVKPADYWDVYFDVTEKTQGAIEATHVNTIHTVWDVHDKEQE